MVSITESIVEDGATSRSWRDRAEPWGRLGCIVIALVLGTHAYRLHLQVPPAWWTWAGELVVASGLTAIALRRPSQPRESAPRRWLRRAFGFITVVLLLIAVDYGSRPGHELAAATATFAALASFFLFRWLPFRDSDVDCLNGGTSESSAPARITGWTLAGVALVTAVAAAATNSSNHLAGLVLWLVSLVSLPLAMSRLYHRVRPDSDSRWKRDAGPQLSRSGEAMAVLTIFVVGVTLRVPLLDRFPAFINSDEARLGRYAQHLWKEGFPDFFGLGWNAFPNLSVLVDHIPIQILGMGIAHLRLAAAFFGLASLVATYLWARRWWGNVVAALAMFILAVNLQHMTWSRTGLNNIQQIFVGALMLATFARALQRRRRVDWVWFGYASGLSFHVYHAAKLFPVILFAAALLYAAGIRGFLRRNLSGGLVAVLGFLFMLGPHLVTIYADWHNFYQNTSNRMDLDVVLDAYNAGSVELVRNYISSHVLSTLYLFTLNQWPFYDPFTCVPALIGLGWMLWCWRDPRHTVVLLWIGSILFIGGMITAYPPNIPRLIGVLPVTCLIPAVVAGRMRGLLHQCLPSRADVVAVPLLLLWLLASAHYNWRAVFVDMPFFQGHDQMTGMCRILDRTPLPATAYTVGSAGEADARIAAIDCMLPLDVDRVTVSQANDPTVLPVPPENRGTAVFFFTRQQLQLVPLARHYYPTAQYDTVESHEGVMQLWAMTLSPQEIDRQRGLQTTFRSGSRVATAAGGLDIIRCADCAEFPVEATAVGTLLITVPGTYALRATEGSLELDGRALSPETQVELYAGWHELVVRTMLEGAGESATVEWKTPEDESWTRIPRELLHTHPERHGLLGRYFARSLPLDSPQPSSEAADYTRLDAALAFDLNPDVDSAPRPPFANKPSTMEWIGTIDLPEGNTQTLRLTTTAATRVFIEGEEVLSTAGGFPAVSEETTLSGIEGRVRILVRTTRPKDDPTWLWWLRLDWREPGGRWTAFVDYDPPEEGNAKF